MLFLGERPCAPQVSPPAWKAGGTAPVGWLARVCSSQGERLVGETSRPPRARLSLPGRKKLSRGQSDG